MNHTQAANIKVGEIYQIVTKGISGDLSWAAENDIIILRNLYPLWPCIDGLLVKITEIPRAGQFIVRPLDEKCRFTCSCLYFKRISLLEVLAKQSE